MDKKLEEGDDLDGCELDFSHEVDRPVKISRGPDAPIEEDEEDGS